MFSRLGGAQVSGAIRETCHQVFLVLKLPRCWIIVRSISRLDRLLLSVSCGFANLPPSGSFFSFLFFFFGRCFRIFYGGDLVPKKVSFHFSFSIAVLLHFSFLPEAPAGASWRDLVQRVELPSLSGSGSSGDPQA